MNFAQIAVSDQLPWQPKLQKKKKKKKTPTKKPNRIFSLEAIRVDAAEAFHYEITPTQIYRKFHLQKLKIFT